jgi:protein-S-isoprenylcysteine O-methyltransferase Ste14
VADHASRLIRVGGWLFRHRTAIPIPLALSILLVRAGEARPTATLLVLGALLPISGEVVRLWGVRHIGVISRTRSDRLGPLIDSGPFALVRNPLYLGNIVIWTGFTLLSRLVWMAPLVVAVLGCEYHAIVRWEEQMLDLRLGSAYRAYRNRVPRWIPNPFASPGGAGAPNSWRETLFSERGTLVTIGLGFLLIWIKLKARS